jgi:dipeptidyl aminopeptidase/acylaminoacyl peptidase
MVEILTNTKELWKYVVRPPRQHYDIDQLGPPHFLISGRACIREDFALVNNRGNRLECSLFKPENCGPHVRLPCVVYLHGNCGSRLECLTSVQWILSKNICLLCFDFAGSGLSQGEYVTLGQHEKDDLGIVLEYLQDCPNIGEIGVLGRSMGAVTALIYKDTNRSIRSAVYDSPFA